MRIQAAALLLLSGSVAAHGADSAAPAPRPTIDELFSAETIPDAALSPSGRYLAIVLRAESRDILIVTDLATDQSQPILKVGKDSPGRHTDMFLWTLHWKSDERLLLRTRVNLEDGARYEDLRNQTQLSLGTRLFAIDRDGGNLVRLLGDNRQSALLGAFNLGAIGSMLPQDPKHIMMLVNGDLGPALFRVDVTTGKGEQVEKPSDGLVGWWLDVSGQPIVRVRRSTDSLTLSRKTADNGWRAFLTARDDALKELPDYQAIGPSHQPDRYYVLARPAGRDRAGLYLYDFKNESFGEPVLEHPQYDLMSAQISRDGKQATRYCYFADVRVCEFTDARSNAHLRGLRRHFTATDNIFVYDSSDDGNIILLHVDGASRAPGFYLYRLDRQSLILLGHKRETLAGKALPSAEVVRWQARDGLPLRGYLTRPTGSADGKSLPLIVMPHGGPERRDRLAFDPVVQFLAARGYGVFQPNFRGSYGFGREFAAKGHGQWGGLMQSDIADGVLHLIETDSVDAKRICIVGSSYGGYAALMGVAQTPDLFRCAVATAGISDLGAFIKSQQRKFGKDSKTLAYWLQSIGDPSGNAERLAHTSPVHLVSQIKAPVLLMHGTDDQTVPYEQSAAMKHALDQAGVAAELIAFKDEDHSNWTDSNRKAWLRAIDRFLEQHLGAGQPR
jgi:dienelactone hydrolase